MLETEGQGNPTMAPPGPPAPSPGAVERAHFRLPAPEREVLAFHAAGLTYDTIADLIGIGAEAVADLVAGGRFRLHDELFGTHHLERAMGDPRCRAVLALAAARADRQAMPWGRSEEGHVGSCPHCAVALDALARADAYYRSWVPGRPSDALRANTLAKASLLCTFGEDTIVVP